MISCPKTGIHFSGSCSGDGARGSEAPSKVTSRPLGSIRRKVVNTSMSLVEGLTQSLSLTGPVSSVSSENGAVRNVTPSLIAAQETMRAGFASLVSPPLGLYPGGTGLYLRVGRGGAKSGAFRFMLDRKAREMGLGGLTKMSLADARKKTADARLLLSDGKDPLMDSVSWCRIDESCGRAHELNLS
jgi:hypothetical protein